MVTRWSLHVPVPGRMRTRNDEPIEPVSESIASRKMRAAARADAVRELREEWKADQKWLEERVMTQNRDFALRLRAHADFLAYLTATHPGRNFTAEFIRFSSERKKAADTASLEMRKAVKPDDGEDSP